MSEIKRLDNDIKTLEGKMMSEIKRLDDSIKALEGKTMSEIKRLEDKIDTLNNKIEVAMEIRERLKAVEAKVGII